MSEVVTGLIGFGAGAAIGYFVIPKPEVLPQIFLNAPTVGGIYQLPEGSTYDIICINFPPNTQLVAPQSLYPSAIVNLGVTDNNGTLTIRGNIARGPAGIYYIIAWNAIDGKYCAVTSLRVT